MSLKRDLDEALKHHRATLGSIEQLSAILLKKLENKSIGNLEKNIEEKNYMIAEMGQHIKNLTEETCCKICGSSENECDCNLCIHPNWMVKSLKARIKNLEDHLDKFNGSDNQQKKVPIK